MKSSIAVGEVLVKWSKSGMRDGTYPWSMDLRGEINVDVHSGATSLEHFLGSITTKITKIDSDQIRVEIFNITSFTSGNLKKDLPLIKWFSGNPNSTLRGTGDIPTSGPTYSNTSQYFSFTMSQKEYSKTIKHYGG